MISRTRHHQRPGRRAATGLVSFAAARVGTAAVLLMVVSMLVFGLMELSPGDAATQALGDRATPERLAALREQYDLDRPAVERYLTWIVGAVQGDLGMSLASGDQVTQTLSGPLSRTAALAGVAAAGVLVIGLGGGIVAGWFSSRRPDTALSGAALVGLSLPEFVTGIVLITVFSLTLRWLPAVSLVPFDGSVWDRPEILLLPATTLTIAAGSYVLRLVRGIVAEQAGQPHVESARLDGIGPARVLFRHLLPGVVGPIAMALAAVVPYVVGGAVVVEQLFGYPGLGKLLVTALGARDQHLLMGVALMLGATTIVVYLLADLVQRMSDPRRAEQ